LVVAFDQGNIGFVSNGMDDAMQDEFHHWFVRCLWLGNVDEHFFQESNVFDVALGSDCVYFDSFVVSCAMSYHCWVNFKWWYISVIVIFFVELSCGKVKCLCFFSDHFDFFEFVE